MSACLGLPPPRRPPRYLHLRASDLCNVFHGWPRPRRSSTQALCDPCAAFSLLCLQYPPHTSGGSSILVIEDAEEFRLLVSSIRDYAIFLLDADGHIVSWNAGAAALYGYGAEEVAGEHFSRFYPEEAQRRRCASSG